MVSPGFIPHTGELSEEYVEEFLKYGASRGADKRGSDRPVGSAFSEAGQILTPLRATCISLVEPTPPDYYRTTDLKPASLVSVPYQRTESRLSRKKS